MRCAEISDRRKSHNWKSSSNSQSRHDERHHLCARHPGLEGTNRAMRHGPIKRLLLILWLALTASLFVPRVSAAVSWPQFRGPNCSGVSESDKPPSEFGPDTNVLW